MGRIWRGRAELPPLSKSMRFAPSGIPAASGVRASVMQAFEPTNAVDEAERADRIRRESAEDQAASRQAESASRSK